MEFAPSLPGLSQRQPPANLAAEQALLGALLANNGAYERIGPLLPEHFADPINGAIFAAIQRRVEKGMLADAVTLAPVFAQNMILDDVGGNAYLAQLLTAMVGIINAGEYAATIREAWVRRQMIGVAEALAEDSFGAGDDRNAQEIASEAVEKIDLAVAKAGLIRSASMSAAVGEAMERHEEALRGVKGRGGLTTGIRCVDDIWRLHPGALDILGGRSREGKTALALQIARWVGRTCLDEGSGCVGLVSLEMSKADVATVNLASMSGVPAASIRKGVATDLEMHALVIAGRKLRDLPIEILDVPRSTLADIGSWLRGLKRRRGLRLAIVDHRDLVGKDAKDRTQRQEFAPFVSARLKELAKTLDVPILLLVQVSRGVETRDDSRPRLSDLMFGSEQDADNVVFVHRPELHLGREPERKIGEKTDSYDERLANWHTVRRAVAGKASLLLEKARFGEPGEARLEFHGPTTTFRDFIEVGPLPMNEEMPFG